MIDVSKKTEPRDCPVCGVHYLADPGRLRHGRQTTCSRACSYVLRAQNKAVPDVVFDCASCGAQVSRTPTHVKGKHGANFCSRKCHYAGRTPGATKRVVLKPYVVTEAGRAAWKAAAWKTVAKRRAGDNYVKSDATLAKMSIATARSIARTQGKFASSKIEHVVAAQLDALGVKYVRQEIVRDDLGRFAAVFDFWLTDLKVALEVNGTYWHADPRVYPIPTGAVQIKCVTKYERKLDLCRRLGIRVVEVWEMDLKQSPSEAVLNAYRQASTG
jgi:G:T-mismatch repair DNA endonuclease (very short patch repair protein)